MEWFRQLSGLEIAYFIIACAGTLLLLIQIILMLVGAGGDADLDTDTDADGMPDTHTDTGVSLFTIKGLTAFFAIGGWMGLVLLSYDVNVGLSIGLSVLAGLVAYFVVWLLVRLVLRLPKPIPHLLEAPLHFLGRQHPALQHAPHPFRQ